MSTAAATTNEGICSGCGRTFRGAAGLRAHQSQRFVSLACKPLKKAPEVAQAQPEVAWVA